MSDQTYEDRLTAAYMALRELLADAEGMQWDEDSSRLLDALGILRPLVKEVTANQ